jgi:UDP-glucose 4-epimerase
VGYDNFSTGLEQFVVAAKKHPGFTFVRGDTLDIEAVKKAMVGCDLVFYLAANADVRFGTAHPLRDLQQNTIATMKILEAMRSNGIRRIATASSGSVYGEPEVFSTPHAASRCRVVGVHRKIRVVERGVRRLLG